MQIDQSVAINGLNAVKNKNGYIFYEDFVPWWNSLHSKKPSRGSAQKIAESLHSVAEGGGVGPAAGPNSPDGQSVASGNAYYDGKPSKHRYLYTLSFIFGFLCICCDVSASLMKSLFRGDSVHLVGVIDSEILSIEDTSVMCKENAFYKNKLPVVGAVLREWSVPGYADWNSRLQSAIESALEAQARLRSGSAPISADPLQEQDSSTVLGSYFTFFSIYGNFLAAVSKGIFQIITCRQS